MGLGGDFDGTPDVTVGLEDVSAYPALFAELLARGWTEADCAALAGGNVLRVLRAAESYAASMSGRSRPDPRATKLSPMTFDTRPADAVAAWPTVLRAVGRPAAC